MSLRPTLDAVEPISFADLDKGLLVPRADFERWLQEHDWTYHQISRNEFPEITFANYYTEQFKPQQRITTLGEFQLRCINNDPGLWVPFFLREPEDPDHLDPYTLWPYQLESMRCIDPTIHKCGAEVGKTREIIARTTWQAFTVPGRIGAHGRAPAHAPRGDHRWQAGAARVERGPEAVAPQAQEGPAQHDALGQRV